MSTKKEVAIIEEVNALPSFIKTDTARGSEQVSSDDVSIPRLSIIQDLSPQRKKNEDKYIDGAEEGMFFNTATNELFTKAVGIIPVFFRKEWVIWKLRKKGGGFFGSFNSDLEAAQSIRDLEGSAEDYEVADTHQHFVIILLEGSTNSNPIMTEAVISCTKSQMKPSRQLNTLAKMAGGDRFSRRYQLEVVGDENRAGEKFFNWKFSAKGFVSEPMYKAAEKCYDSIASGKRTIRQDDPVEGKVVEPATDGIEDDF